MTYEYHGEDPVAEQSEMNEKECITNAAKWQYTPEQALHDCDACDLLCIDCPFAQKCPECESAVNEELIPIPNISNAFIKHYVCTSISCEWKGDLP